MAKTKLVVNEVYKIFGPRPQEAYDLIEQGKSKDEIFEETGMTVGVQDASFEVYEGEVFVVMGLSGSGKSTMVRMLNRLIEPTFGKIEIDGHDIVKMSKEELIQLRRREMAMVFQSFALMPHQTVIDNAAFGLEVAGVDRETRYERALKSLDAVGLKANAHSYPDELSGGMKQRVGLARALSNDPSIMLMDEAFSALDPLIRTEMQDELLRLQSESQRTVIFITHDLDEAMRIGDRIAVMEDGRIVQIGTPEEIVTKPADEYVSSFFKGVDVTQVFTAGDIARKQQLTVIERPGSDLNSAIQAMRGKDRDVAIVLDKHQHYEGMVSASSLAEAKNGDGKIQSAFLKDVEPVTGDMGLSDVLHQVANSAYPIPVLDGNKKYIGAISKTALLQTLDRAS
ncbi:glycine betaine/L-proline ABC transporter ATP-binding protein ProV [Ferruginivarius sediminum]|uniref:Quaternary amine transport ATP-binding protein n=1 Tax=Ferruginivarius sediminum TaxID=2661937 RepID=A0A369T7L3_9PROT|nr:glycine betaine/L-proline ABC transporter ATP-binding protein ProV [Ferruginivarius sediminum]RDD61329.1 proline/glycine betaine ABC transporter ATP-binding protein ProV [Ferruginivarius sediminum]